MSDRKRDLPAEMVARAILHALVPGMEARFRYQQHHGEHDYDLYRGAHQIGVLEVTVSANRQMKEDIAAVDREKHGGPILRRKDVSYGWDITAMPGASIKEIRKKVSGHLAAIEAEGLQRFSIQDVTTSPAVRRIVDDLRVAYGYRFIPTKADGLVFLSHPSGQMLPVNSACALDVVRLEMEKPDIKRKLSDAANHAERHLFVVIDPDHGAPWRSLNDCEPPEEAADLGNEITHLWVGTLSRNPDEWIVWYTARGQSWKRTFFKGRIEADEK